MNSAVSVRDRARCAFVTWKNSFVFVRVLTGLAAYACSIFATTYLLIIEDAKDMKAGNVSTSSAISEAFAVFGTASAILLLPFILLGKHLLIVHYIPKRPRRSATKWRLSMRTASLLLTSLTMFGSVTVTPTDDGKTVGVKLVVFLLSSIILCETSLLDNDNYGVFELTLCVLLVQMSKAFPKIIWLSLYGIILLSYGAKEMMFWIMKQIKKKAVHGETERKKKDVDELTELWNTTDLRLRNELHIDVNDQLPTFRRMKVVIDSMAEKDIEEQ